ncbi:MAG: sialidase family protein [Acidobacteriota bacterium]
MNLKSGRIFEVTIIVLIFAFFSMGLIFWSPGIAEHSGEGINPRERDQSQNPPVFRPDVSGQRVFRRSSIVEEDYARKEIPAPPAALSERALEGTNVRVNVVTTGRQNETSIDYNPVDHLNLVGGANDYRNGEVDAGYYYSKDGGATWGDGTIVETTFEAQGDPAVAFCANGYVYYSFISFNRSSDDNGLFVARSTDGGATWPLVKDIVMNFGSFVPFEDKEYIACDTTNSSYKNYVYVSWTRFNIWKSTIMLSRSTDGGKSYSQPMTISDAGGVQGSVPAVGSNGEVYVIWEGSPATFYLDISTNGGKSFGTDKKVVDIVDISDSPCYRRNSFPAFDVDISSSAYRGSLYVAWSDNRNGDPDIYFTYSRDKGTTWATPKRINTDPVGNDRDQFFPWLSVDNKGRVNVIWYDARRDPGNRWLEVWGAVSRDGGQSFDTNFLISDVSFDPCLDTFLGDYNGVVATPNDRIFPLWSDLRSGEEDVYTNDTRNFDLDEVKNLAVQGKNPTELSWESQDPKFGAETNYDVISGLLGELSVDRNFSRSICLSNDVPDTPFNDTRADPQEGDGFYYLVRSQKGSSYGSFGDGTGHPNARDDLDESAPCP